MGHISRDVKEVSGASDEVFFKALSKPHASFAAQDIDGAFRGYHACAPLRAQAWGVHRPDEKDAFGIITAQANPAHAKLSPTGRRLTQPLPKKESRCAAVGPAPTPAVGVVAILRIGDS